MGNGQLNLGKQSGGVLSVSFPDGDTNTEVILPESGNLVSIDTAVTNNAIARYDGTTGKLQDSGVIIDDSGNVGMGIIPNVNYLLDIGASKGVRFALFNVVRSGTGYPAYGYNIRRTDTNGVYNYDRADSASMVEIGNMTWTWKTAPSGVEGQPITWTNTMKLDTSGNLLLTSGTGALGYGTGAGGSVTQLTSKSTSVTLNKPCGVIVTHNAALAAGGSVIFAINNTLASFNDTTIAASKNGNYEAHAYATKVGIIYIRLTNLTTEALSDAVTISFNIIKGSNN